MQLEIRKKLIFYVFRLTIGLKNTETFRSMDYIITWTFVDTSQKDC